MDERKNKVYSNPVAAMVCKIWDSSLHPYGTFHSIWDVGILVLVFFSAVWEPLKAGFLGGNMAAWEWCIDITFYVDIILAFWTGYDCGFEIVTDKRMIATRYLKGWFIIDAAATIEWDLIVGKVSPSTDAGVVRLCKLIKIARLARASRLINRLTSTWTINTAYIEAIKFFVYVLICAHILACFFFMFPALIGDNVDEHVCRSYKSFGDIGYGVGTQSTDPAVKYGSCLKPGTTTTQTKEEVLTGTLTHVNLLIAYPSNDFVSDCDSDQTCMDGHLATACAAAGGTWLIGDHAMNQIDLIHNHPAEGFDTEYICVEDGFAEHLDLVTERMVSACENKCVDAGNVWEPARGSTGPWGGDTEGYCDDMPHINSCSWRLKRGGSDGMVGDLVLPSSQYIQSMYWSLTTMTTIGYGDRFPNTESETILCMVCEIIGLSFFALLLTQINNLNDVLGKEVQESNDVKNSIVGFMKYNELPEALIEDVICYLNFKSSSIAGFYFTDDDSRFDSLSDELKKDTKLALFTPALQRVKMFGYSKEDEREKEKVHAMFKKTDTDGGGFLDKGEIGGLTKRLQIEFSDDQLIQAMNEMDPECNNAVDVEEFESWWFLKKNGVKRAPPAPMPFLHELASTMSVSACSPGDPILACGEYGNELVIVLTGTVEVVQRDQLWREGKFEHEVLQRTVKNDDREPICGLPACLERNSDRAVLAETTQEWFARASKMHPDGFCDIALARGEDVRQMVREHWPEGAKVWLGIARNQYHAFWHDNEMEEANRRASAVGIGQSEQDRVAALEERVENHLEQLRQEVDTTIGALGSKLDALLAKAS